MKSLFDRIQETAAFIRKTSSLETRIGIILGTGLGGLAGEVEVEAEFSYRELPHFLWPRWKLTRGGCS